MDQRIPQDPPDSRTEVFGELYAVHYRPLVALCRRLVGTRESEELAQEAFLRAWASWDRFAPSRPFWPWVSTIARRLCIDRGRRLQTAQEHGPRVVGSREPAAPLPEDMLELREEYRWALAALAELRPDHQRVLRMREFDGWSYDRIADHEGVSVESVRGSLRRARSQLRLVYARMSAANPVVVLVVFMRSFRRRLSGWAYRVQDQAAASGVVLSRAGDAMAAIVAIAVGTVGVAVPVTASSHGGRPGTMASGGSVSAALGDRSGASTTTTAGRGAEDGSGANIVRHGGRTRSDVDVKGTNVTFDVPGRGNDAPEATSFQSFTLSPQYERDHEIWASGYAYEDCTVSCPSLFHSTDGGASWTRVRSVMFEGGPVMLPPAYPADKRLFVGGPHALKVSSDGGRSFTPLTPAGGFTAMSPAFSAGDPHIFVGAIPGWIYHDDTKAVTPLDSVPESTSAALSLAYAPAYPADHRRVIGGTDTSPDARSIVSVCDGSVCTAPAVLPGSTGTPAVMTSRRYKDTNVAFAWQLSRIFRSTDGGATFSQLTLPAAGLVQSVADDGAGHLYVALLDNQPGTTSGGLFVSSDWGHTWSRLGAGTALDRGVLSVAPVPGGRLLAGPFAPTGGGLLCSPDGGRSWAPRCE